MSSNSPQPSKGLWNETYVFTRRLHHHWWFLGQIGYKGLWAAPWSCRMGYWLERDPFPALPTSLSGALMFCLVPEAGYYPNVP